MDVMLPSRKELADHGGFAASEGAAVAAHSKTVSPQAKAPSRADALDKGRSRRPRSVGRYKPVTAGGPRVL
jgi:hypothetical protein